MSHDISVRVNCLQIGLGNLKDSPNSVSIRI